MAAKQLVFQDEATRKLKRGVDILANTVKTTLGPKGRNVALARKFGAPLVTHDGVTVAKEIELPDQFENMGAQLVKEVASKTNDVAGDGTTTATVLAQAIVNEGLRVVAAGANPMQLRNGIEQATNILVRELKAQAIQVKGKEDMEHVATISAADPHIGQILADVMSKVGKDGVVTIEEGKGRDYEIEYTEGMQFDRGYISAYFVTNSERMEAQIENPYILITDKKISAMADLVPVLEKVVGTGTRNFVIIAEDVDGEALATLVLNKLRGTVNVLAVKAPGFGDRRKEMLRDIATLTGGQVITEELGRKVENTEVSDLGQARLVIATKDNTTIVEGRGKQAEIEARIGQIKNQIRETTSDYDKEKLQERLAKLSGGVGVIKVGASTETELKERKARIEDAMNATRAAVEEGIVPGGGIALLNAIEGLKQLDDKLKGDAMIGANLLKKALEEPLRQIAANAGLDGSVILSQVRAEQKARNNPNIGYDVMSGQICDVVECGIIDPVKVTRSALENAASIATMILSTEALITDLPEKPAAGAAQGANGMGGMDDF